MPEPPDSAREEPRAGELVPAEEVTPDAVLPAIDEPRAIEPRPVTLPAAVAAATGGFLLGVATFVLVRILRRPRGPGRRGRVVRRNGRGQRVDISATRSFLVDVHLLDRR